MAYYDTIKLSAEKKMAIVDALSPESRAIVHEIGLDRFSRKHRKTYLAAKKRAGINGMMKHHQIKRVAKTINQKEAA